MLQYRRTALHYAYATKETRQTKDIVALLYEFGASEHCLDKVLLLYIYIYNCCVFLPWR